MRLQFVESYGIVTRHLLDVPFRDGFANIKEAFVPSEKISFKGLHTEAGIVSKEIPARDLADRVAQFCTGVFLLIPVVNIVLDIALRHFTLIKGEEGDDYYRRIRSRTGGDLLEGLNSNRISGGVNGLQRVLDDEISPRIMNILKDSNIKGSFQYAICPDQPICLPFQPVGGGSHFLHLKVEANGETVEWRRRIVHYTDREFTNVVSTRQIAEDVLTKLSRLNLGPF